LASVIEDKQTARVRGDFQTPEELARLVWSAVDAAGADLVVEPTFGAGSFLTTIPDDCRAGVVGWEINEEYFGATAGKLGGGRGRRKFKLIPKDVFDSRPEDIPSTPATSVLVVGNPPWVTNSEQGSLGGDNTGKKYNLKGLPGFSAMTGKANFDISEAIILRFVSHLKGRCRRAQFAVLGKFTVLRNLMQFLAKDPTVGEFEYHRIDSSYYFDASVDAGLIKFKVGVPSNGRLTCPVFEGVGGPRVGEIGFAGGQFVYDLEAYNRTSFMEAGGFCDYVWRQGIKHDLSKVMELTEEGGNLRNGLGEVVDVEEECLYQLYKSSDVYHGRRSRYVIPVYQRDLQDTMEDLPEKFPRLYRYLTKHKELFAARKSSIYKGRPPFTVFGIGEYTHARYKVAIAGLYSEPVFRLLRPEPRPVALDDTCYMLATDSHREALYLLAVLGTDEARDFLKAISSPTDKRRFSKDVLERVKIPPISSCPEPILQHIRGTWRDADAVPGHVKRQLRDWLAGLGGREKERLPAGMQA
jgi:hypothetical protein